MTKRKKQAPHKISATQIKAAADRAEARSKGKAPKKPKAFVDPAIVKAEVPMFVDAREVVRVRPGPGKPTLYRVEYCQTVAELALNGATDEEIAEDLDVTVRTLYRWRAAHPEFRQATKWGKDACDERVERSLYARAIGYTYDAVKTVQEDGKMRFVTYKEHAPPDVGAAKWWLANRRPKDWKDISKHEVGRPGDFDEMTEAELHEFVLVEAQELLAGEAGKATKANGTKH